MAEVEKGDPKTVEEGDEMKPWEQHYSVISIPRYDYNAPSALLRHSYSGFLITCSIKKEKSATKEAISILAQFMESDSADCLEGDGRTENAKRRKLCPVGGESDEIIKSELSKDEFSPSGETNSSLNEISKLVLVKMTRSGLVLFTLPKGSSFDLVKIISHVYRSIDSKALKQPLWCHRILPIQATCRLNENEVSRTVSNLILKYIDDKSNILSKPLKFAVGYNRRGIEKTEMKSVKDNPSDPTMCVLLDRDKCFSIVAAAVKKAVSDSTVDLKSPELCILIELLPVSGMPNGSLVAAISVLPRVLVDTKPRLSIRALGSDAKAKTG